MTSNTVKGERSSTTGIDRIKIGIAGGLVGGFSVLLSVFAIDSHLGTTPGSFYKVVGLPFGLDGIFATLFGLLAHMLTAILIGTIFCYCSGLHSKLELTSSKKGVMAGTISAIVVYVAFFIPITLFVVQPSLEAGAQNEFGIIASLPNIESAKMVKNMNLIILGALEIHIVFGIIMGVFCAMVIRATRKRAYKINGMIKTVIIGVVLGTITAAAYYAIISEYSPPESPDEITLNLDRLQDGLTYVKFLSMDEENQTLLVNQMPSETRNLLINHAKNFGSEINEDIQIITKNLESPDDLRYAKTAEIQGLKGNQAGGKAMVISTGKTDYLRLEDFFVTNGIGLHVYITKSGDVSSGYDLGKLKATNGDQNYQLPPINTDEYDTVVIYSKPFAIYYASANLR